MTAGPESLPMPMPSREPLQVGGWTVEPTLNRISTADRSERLEPKAMAVLVHLADRPGQVVARSALLSAVWGDVVVGDDSLTQVVIKLRKALGDLPDQPTYIQTIPKGGYRLIAPVVRAAPAASAPLNPDGTSSRMTVPAARTRWRFPRAAAAGIVASSLIAMAAWWTLDSRPPDARTRQSVVAGTVAVHSAPPTVTIRPFETPGDDPRALLLAAGITADLVTDLSKVSAVSVVVVAPLGQEIGKLASDVPRYVVSGSVQRVEERLRVGVQLTDAETGKQVWSERFDRPLGSFYAIQEELGPKILRMLPVKVSEAELQRLARPHTRNLEAYEHFQRGQAALLRRQQADNETARVMFWRAIALDATFARAYAGLALTYAADYRNQWSRDGAAALERAFELARTAHEISPDVSQTYWVLAFVHMERRQHEQALRYLETAVALSPSFADGYALMGGIQTYVGRPEATVSLLRTAMRLNPDAGYLYYLLLGRAYLFRGDLEQARVNLDVALSRNPHSLEAHVYMAALLVMAGDHAAAAWQAEEIRVLSPGFSSRAWLETYPMTDTAQRSQVLQALAQLASVTVACSGGALIQPARGLRACPLEHQEGQPQNATMCGRRVFESSAAMRRPSPIPE